jgi:hypothetical protein
MVRDGTLKCFGKKRKKAYRSVVFDVRGVESWRRGGTRDILKSEEIQPVVRDELMREVRNGKRSPERVWRREEGMESSEQVVGLPDFISRRISSEERWEKEIKA